MPTTDLQSANNILLKEHSSRTQQTTNAAAVPLQRMHLEPVLQDY